MKPKLIIFYGNNNLTNPLVEPNMREYFDFVPYTPNAIYNKSDSVFVLNEYQYAEFKDIIDGLISNGHKVVFENLHEASLPIKEYANQANVLQIVAAIRNEYSYNTIQVPLYFWYCESKAWSGKIMNYKNMERFSNFDKKFLLMMNYPRNFRNQIYETFTDILPSALYSYVDRGIRLPGDTEKTSMYWDRYANPDWYNRTQFSVVVETAMTLGQGNIFLTEKTMKPLALKHPYITLACAQSMTLLKRVGFESYENLFDESYDGMDSYTDRISAVYTQVKNCNIGKEYDYVTKQKIEQNYNLFFNDAEVDHRFKLDIIDPILKFLNE